MSAGTSRRAIDKISADGSLLSSATEILIVNGAETGVAGYGNVKDQAGQSNADNPAYTPVLYDPSTSSFSSEGMPTSKIARMYHSVASLLPSGEVLLAGSNPNLDRTTASFPTSVGAAQRLGMTSLMYCFTCPAASTGWRRLRLRTCTKIGQY